MLKNLYKFFHSRYQNLFLDYPVDMQPRYGHGKSAHQGLENIIHLERDQYKDILRSILEYQVQLNTIQNASKEDNTQLPVWNNNFLPGLDIAALYTIISKYKPHRYIEVGSGNSTKVVAKAILDHALSTEITSIDPIPRAEIDVLADHIIRKPLEKIDISLFHDLQAGDVVFIDNSHRMLPNSDATVFFLDVLPSLPKGVIVHIHDIYLPYDYPQFMCDRAYSEQYGLAIALLSNPEKYKTLFPAYFISEDSELASILTPFWESLPVKVEIHGGSYWMQIRK